MEVRKQDKCSILSSQVDWFTCTWKPGLMQRFAHRRALDWLEAVEKEGGKVEAANRLGFVGDKTDGFFVGQQDKLLMVIASGDRAGALAASYLPTATNITRLDLQVTLHDVNTGRDWTRRAFNQVSVDARVEQGILKTHRIVGSPDGRTLYIGSRASDRFFRLYDKTAESDQPWPNRTWRWEVEYKAGRALTVGKAVIQGLTVERQVLGAVRNSYADVNVQLPCDGLPTNFTDRSLRKKTTSETRLAWTETTVAPFLKNLADAAGPWRVGVALKNGGVNLPEDWYNPAKGGTRG